MKTPIQEYQQCGKKAAFARFHGDESTAQSHYLYSIRCNNLESDNDAQTARKAFDDSYKTESRKLRGFKA